MAIAVDASSPAIVTGLGTGSVTTASFTPPNGSLVLAIAIGGWSDAGTTTCALSDSLSGTWTSRVTCNSASNNSSDFGGVVQISTRTGTGSAMTVTATYTFGSATAGGKHLAVFVLTGASASSFGATATLNDTSLGNDLTCSLTTTQIGSLVLGGFLENKGSNRTLVAGSNITLATGLSGSNPYDNATDFVDSCFGKATAVTSTLSTNNYAVTWSGSQGFGKVALIEVLPGVSNVTGADATTNIIESAGVQATLAASDTGSLTGETATVRVGIASSDTGSLTGESATVRVLSGDTSLTNDANKVLSGGSTLAFGQDNVGSLEAATLTVVDSEAIATLEMATTAVQGRLNAGQRIVRVQAEDRTDYVVR